MASAWKTLSGIAFHSSSPMETLPVPLPLPERRAASMIGHPPSGYFPRRMRMRQNPARRRLACWGKSKVLTIRLSPDFKWISYDVGPWGFLGGMGGPLFYGPPQDCERGTSPVEGGGTGVAVRGPNRRFDVKGSEARRYFLVRRKCQETANTIGMLVFGTAFLPVVRNGL